MKWLTFKSKMLPSLIPFYFKGALLRLRQYLAAAFYLTLKFPSILKKFKFLS